MPEERGAASRFLTGFSQGMRDEPAGDTASRFAASFARAKDAQAAEQQRQGGPGLATFMDPASQMNPVARGPRQPAWKVVEQRKEDEQVNAQQEHQNELARIRADAPAEAPRAGLGALAAQEAPAAPLLHGVVPNRQNPDEMSNADFLVAHGMPGAPPEENPYRQSGVVRDVEPEANPYPRNPYR